MLEYNSELVREINGTIYFLQNFFKTILSFHSKQKLLRKLKRKKLIDNFEKKSQF
jgi:hypothetical protein